MTGFGQLTSYAVTVGNAAAVRVGASSPVGSAGGRARAMTVVNTSSVVVYVGDANVTSSSGTPIQPTQEWRWSGHPDVVYLIAVSGASNDVRVIEAR